MVLPRHWPLRSRGGLATLLGGSFVGMNWRGVACDALVIHAKRVLCWALAKAPPLQVFRAPQSQVVKPILREQIRHIRSRLKTLNQNLDAPVPLHPNLGDIDFWSFVRRE